MADFRRISLFPYHRAGARLLRISYTFYGGARPSHYIVQWAEVMDWYVAGLDYDIAKGICAQEIGARVI